MLHGRYPASCYYGPVRRPPAVSPLPAFGYRAYLASRNFSRGREGLLQLPGDALLPCCRFHPAQASPLIGWFESERYCLRPLNTGSALRFVNDEATFTFTHHCGPEARSPRFHGALSMGSEVSVSLNPAIQATRPPAPTASGLSPYSHHLPYPGHAFMPDPIVPSRRGSEASGWSQGGRESALARCRAIPWSSSDHRPQDYDQTNSRIPGPCNRAHGRRMCRPCSSAPGSRACGPGERRDGR